MHIHMCVSCIIIIVRIDMFFDGVCVWLRLVSEIRATFAKYMNREVKKPTVDCESSHTYQHTPHIYGKRISAKPPIEKELAHSLTHHHQNHCVCREVPTIRKQNRAEHADYKPKPQQIIAYRKTYSVWSFVLGSSVFFYLRVCKFERLCFLMGRLQSGLRARKVRLYCRMQSYIGVDIQKL